MMHHKQTFNFRQSRRNHKHGTVKMRKRHVFCKTPINGRVDGRVDGQVDGWVDGWVDGRTDGG